MSFLGELKRRNVVKVAAAYLVASWLIVQIVDVLTSPLGLPDILDTVVVVLLAIGFPFALVVAWVYEVTPEGIRVTSNVPDANPGSSPSSQRLSYVLIGLLVIAVGLMVVNNFSLEPTSDEFGTGSRLAVLPCDDLSPDPTNSFFAVGIHEELLNRLAALSALEVISRTSVQQYATRRPPIPEIASALNADAILECSARYAGDRVLLTAQLIDGSSDTHLWSQSYPADMSDLRSLFEIQAELAMNVANTLHITFFDTEREQIERVPTESREAYQLFLAAQPGNSCGGLCNPEAVELLDEALSLDDQFVDAWTKKSYAHSNMIIVDRDENLAAAEFAADRAIALAPERGGGYAMKALALSARGEWLGADSNYAQARRLGYSPAPDSRFLMAVGEIEASLAEVERQLDVDPLNSELFVFGFLTQETLGNQAAADDYFERGDRLFREAWAGAGIYRWLLLGRGEAGPEPSPDPAAVAGIAGAVFDVRDDPARALAIIDEMAAPGSGIVLGNAALWAAYFGDAQAAMRYFRGTVAGSGYLMIMAWLPVFEEMRQLPEFKEFLVDIGMVDYWRATDWPDVCRPTATDFECV